MKAFVALLLLSLVVTICAARSYNGYKLVRVKPTTDSQVRKLKQLQDNVKLDFWSDPFKGRSTDINVPPTEIRKLYRSLKKMRLQPQVIQNDVQQLIDSTSKASSMKDELLKALAAKGLSHPKAAKFIEKGKGGPLWLRKAINEIRAEMASRANMTAMSGNTQFDIVNSFPVYDDVTRWLERMASTFSDLATTEDIGQTYEGRQMKMIKIGKPSIKGEQKPIIWVDSAIHAREWLTVGTTIWIINKMLTTYSTDSLVQELMDHYDWYFLPVANPDGYEYTHTNDRLWRKTRSRISSSSCVGTDPNRNFDFKWRASGTSTNPCSSTYGGPSAFSEKCTQNMRDAVLRVADRVKMYMGIHSYSQLWLMPYAWGGNKPSDYNELLRVANEGNNALYQVHRSYFEVGTPPDILYAASGGAYDWAKAVAGIKYSYTFELRPSGSAWNGFVVNEREIEPSGEEIWAALAKVAQELKTV